MSWNPIQNWSILKRALFDPHPRQIRLNTFQMKPFYRKMNHLNSQNSQVTFPRSSTVHVVFLSLVSFRNQLIVFSITSSWQFALNQMRSRLFDSNRRPSWGESSISHQFKNYNSLKSLRSYLIIWSILLGDFGRFVGLFNKIWSTIWSVNKTIIVTLLNRFGLNVKFYA